MKKIMILASILTVLFLVGCIPPEEIETPCKKPYTKIGEKCCMDLNENKICDSDEQPFQPEEKPVSGTDLMQKYQDALMAAGGYSYKYDEDTYKVNEPMVKRELVQLTKIPVDEPVGPKKITMPYADAVYFDTAEKKAVAYCEGLDDTSERMCAGFELWDIEIPVDYDKYYAKTPTDWLNQFADKEPSEIKENYRYEVSGVEVTGLVFVEEGKTIILDIDPKTGIVWRVTIDEDGYVEEYQYSDVKTGIGEVMHVSKEKPEKPVLSETGEPAVPDAANTE
ncbi:hypothetical protein GF358_01115 [Candidatus Woesearchaeota archaeon]|nr:hypothetical protein [Candidatus Woesearchaeota archaeon]